MEKYEYDIQMINFLAITAKVLLIIVAILLGIVLISNTYESGVRSVQKQAINRKFAHWECNNNGEATFVWNSVQ